MVRKSEIRGALPISREPPIMRDLQKLKELPPRGSNESLSVLEREAILVGMFWGLCRYCDLFLGSPGVATWDIQAMKNSQ